jgi:hypothetical protein
LLSSSCNSAGCSASIGIWLVLVVVVAVADSGLVVEVLVVRAAPTAWIVSFPLLGRFQSSW